MSRVLRETSRYAQVGLVCAILNNAVVIVMDRAGFHYMLAVVTAFLSVTLVGYVLHSIYTFAASVRRSALAKFAAASLVGACWSMLLMILLCDGLNLSATIAMPIATLLLFAWNYGAARWAILPRSELLPRIR